MREHVAGNPLSGAECIEYVKQRTDTVMLSFSAGKDSLAAWLALRDHFRVVPVFMYYIPGLRFVEEGLKYYEEVFGTHIIRLPNPALFHAIADGAYQPADRILSIEELQIGEFSEGFSRDKLFEIVRDDWGLPKESYVAMGVRAADSPNRRATIMKYGCINEKRVPPTFQPVWDWNKDRLVQTLSQSGVKLTDDYRLFGRSFDGIDYRFLEPIRRHHPEDYQTILDWFPMADTDLMRHEITMRKKAREAGKPYTMKRFWEPGT